MGSRRPRKRDPARSRGGKCRYLGGIRSLVSFVQGMLELGELTRHLVESSHQLGLALRAVGEPTVAAVEEALGQSAGQQRDEPDAVAITTVATTRPRAVVG